MDIELEPVGEPDRLHVQRVPLPHGAMAMLVVRHAEDCTRRTLASVCECTPRYQLAWGPRDKLIKFVLVNGYILTEP